MVGVGFNLACFYWRELYNSLFFFQPILLLLLGGTFLALIIWALLRKRRDRRWLITTVAFAVITPLVFFYNPEWLRSETILRARLIDDLNQLDLRIRKDGSCTTEAVGVLGFSWEFHGRCEVDGSTVIFHEPPYDADIFSERATIIGDKLILRYQDGEPVTSFATYFEIYFRPE